MDPDLIPYMETENYLEAAPWAEAEEQPKRRASFVAVVAAALAVVAELIGLGLTAFSRKNGPSPVLNWHLALSALSLGVALFCAAWAFLARRKAALGHSPSALLSLLAFISALSLAAYHAVAVVALRLNSCSGTGAVLLPAAKALNVKARLAAAGSGAALQSGLCLASVAAAVCFALIAFAAFNALSNKLQTSKIALLLALPGVGVLAGAGLALSLGNAQLLAALAPHLPSVPHLPCVFAGLLIAALALAALNALGSLFRSEALHFLLGFLWLFLGLALLFAGGLALRDARRGSCGRGLSCRAAADLLPADSYGRFCPQGKYLAAGRSCRRADLVGRWETDGQPAYLNRGCCAAASGAALWPVLLLGLTALAVAAAAGVAAAANFAHVEVDELFSDYFRAFNPIDLLTLLLVAAVIGASAVAVLRAQRAQKRVRVRSPAFLPAVPASRPLPPMCYELQAASLPALSVGNCTGRKCGVAVGLAALNGRFDPGLQLPAGVERRDGSLREAFFASDAKGSSEFLALRGTVEAVGRALAGVRVCQASLSQPHFVVARALPADLKAPFARLPGAPAPLSLRRAPQLAPTRACAAPCDALLVSHAGQSVTLHGRLLVKDAGGRLVSYGVPEAGVELAFGTAQAAGFTALSAGSYDAAGRFSLAAPLSAGSGYVGTLRVTDRKKHYVDHAVHVAVTRPPAGARALDLGDIVLTTVSGKGCKGRELSAALACFAAQRRAQHALRVELVEAMGGGRPRTPLRYTLRRGYSRAGAVVLGPRAAVNGRVEARLPAGYYTLLLEGADHATRAVPVLLDQSREAVVELLPAGGPLRIFLESHALDFDYELNARTRDAQGKECVASTLHPRCPGAHKRVEGAAGGREYDVLEVGRGGEAAVFVTRTPAVAECVPKGRPAHARAYSLFSSDWGAAEYPAGLGNARLAGVAAASAALPARSGPLPGFAFLPQLWGAGAGAGTGAAVQTGRFVHFPALFAAVKRQVERSPPRLVLPDPRVYFDFLAGEPDRARLFVRAMPILYGNEDGKLAAVLAGLATTAGLSAAMRAALAESSDALRADGFAYNAKSLAALSSAILLAQKDKTRAPASAGVVFAPSAAAEKAFAAQSGAPALTVLAGVGEEPYTVLANRTRAVKDVEVGVDCGPALPLRPLLAPAVENGLVGVVLCGRIGIAGGKPPVCTDAPPRPVDLRQLLPAAARPALTPATHTNVFFAQLVASADPRVAQYLKEDLGGVHVTLANGTVVHSTLFDEVLRKELLRSEERAEGRLLSYDDGSSTMLFANGTAVRAGPGAAFFRWLVPVTEETTVLTRSWVEREERGRHALGLSDLVEEVLEREQPAHALEAAAESAAPLQGEEDAAPEPLAELPTDAAGLSA